MKGIPKKGFLIDNIKGLKYTLIPVYFVDAFTSAAFCGNPAAVCLLLEQADEQWMQKMAAEINLSETAFVTETEGGFVLRWFTPISEVNLCGHATLAAAFVLWHTGRLGKDKPAVFHTRSGVLTVFQDSDEAEGWIKMDFPAEAPIPAQAPEALIQGLGLIPRYTGRNRMDYIVEVDCEQTVRELQPDFLLLRSLDTRGVIITAKASPECGYDFVSRAFFPAIGVDEDPVTGSSHCALAPYWSKRLRKPVLTGYQASSRGGFIRTELAGERVLLSGQAVMMMEGQLGKSVVEG
ncbi:PhzF family phenazine biosynthesis protein [Paenibacillus pinihumi]|uniref:PhzF family phenazine biosynthesis protein n=1 Tax=Paenibacillus pinihumi TaxID=669462 RepID=UPI00041D6953|nr:PhzF family phenazine biosynthesis protein [Paenibacillus pinihumi]